VYCIELSRINRRAEIKNIILTLSFAKTADKKLTEKSGEKT
jgi:hypothetical protein